MPETGFIKNVNTIADKIAIIEEANSIFDEGVVNVLEEIALLDLDEAIEDLKKGNYLGNRKLDINLALNMIGVTEDLLLNDPDAAEAIWVDTTKAVQYSGATITFNDGVVIALPFLFDGSPTTVSTHGDLITQLSRYDLTNAIRQVATVSDIVAINSTTYTVTINGTVLTYVSDVSATIAEIVTGLVNTINLDPVPVTAAETGTSFTLSADVVGVAFTAAVNANMSIASTVVNGEAVIAETAFLSKMNDTILASFATNVVGEIIRAYDVVGQNSNLERIQLHAVSGQFIDPNPVYYWAKTTSAFQTLSMRAGDIIKLGNDIDSIITLASRISEMLDLQNKLPQLVTNGDSLYTNIAKLVAIYEQLVAIVSVHNDTKIGGTNYVNTVAIDLGLIDSKIKLVATNIVAVQNASANAATATAQATVATTQAGVATAQATISTAQAVIASAQATLATNKANAILGLTTQATTGAAGSLATVSYNSTDGKLTFNIPQGIQGARGEAFTVNAVGLATDKALYNAQIKGFSFLAIDTALIYFKLSATSADWSIGSPFGKGDTGNTGATGNGIASITFLSTTDGGGVAGAAGATDTYRITATDATTYNFVVYNGLNGVLINDTVLSLIATWSNQKISDQLALKAPLASPTFTGTVSGITAAMVGAPSGSGIVTNTNTGDETTATIKTKLGIATLSGSNTGDQVLPTLSSLGAQATLVSGANIKTVNSASILGSGDIIISVGLVREEVAGTTQTCVSGKDYWAENVAATAFTAPAAVNLNNFAVTPANGLLTNTIDFGGAIVRGPAGTETGVLTLNLGLRMEFLYSSTLAKWVVL